MKANELRIGNWVEWQGFYHRKKPAQLTNIPTTEKVLDDIKPIPLTEEWLERLGFEKRIYDSEDTGYGFDYFLFWEGEQREGFTLVYEDDFSLTIYAENRESDLGTTPSIDRFKYVHQLQNLYFVLTGEELEIKKYASSKEK